jgi:hypothetical protein
LVNSIAVRSAINGFLYFPISTGCSAIDVPNNGVPDGGIQSKDLPGDVDRIALIWNTQCAGALVVQANEENVEAIILCEYLANETQYLPPSEAPVYGITPDDTNELVKNLQLYSRNVSSVPNSEALSGSFAPNALVRVELTITPASLGQRADVPTGLLSALLLGWIMGYILHWCGE